MLSTALLINHLISKPKEEESNTRWSYESTEKSSDASDTKHEEFFTAESSQPTDISSQKQEKIDEINQGIGIILEKILEKN